MSLLDGRPALWCSMRVTIMLQAMIFGPFLAEKNMVIVRTWDF
jgi:hypothetical protein